jgi:hypothetical protein
VTTASKVCAGNDGSRSAASPCRRRAVSSGETTAARRYNERRDHWSCSHGWCEFKEGAGWGSRRRRKAQ